MASTTRCNASIGGAWDMIIAFPPCTHLAVSGAAWFAEKIKDGRQQQGIDFFMLFVNANCPKVAIENPVGIMSRVWRKPVFRVETPCLIPPDMAIGSLPYYKIDDRYVLRAESTHGTYWVMDHSTHQLPVCLYQMNKSFRDEKSDAMRIGSMRYREFWQLEFQLFYSPTTKADYHQMFVDSFKWRGVFVELPKHDMPGYSLRTTDIEIDGTEIASLSTRKDYKVPVFEMSFGLDRIIQK